MNNFVRLQQVMESIRQRQVGELIRRQFSAVLSTEGRYVYGPQALVTVTQVTMSPDLGLAKIYLSIFNVANKLALVSALEEHNLRLKTSLHQRIRKQVRHMPELRFYIDEMVDEVYRVEALFKKYEGKAGSTKDEEE
ncbi:MAG: Ribosome-binding factor A [Saprospiraceae bacterium]|jgi:ribosome-binding factor A|nr:Ribosome-binding factor A [Saprospiraceae bacterium]